MRIRSVEMHLWMKMQVGALPGFESVVGGANIPSRENERDINPYAALLWCSSMGQLLL
jgi:hypothetical protein